MNALKKINFLLDALEDGEANFHFDEGRLGQRRLNRTLNRLKKLYDKESASVREQERYYGQTIRLLRVLSHEIMNSLAPIASLSDSLKAVSGEQLQSGLDTISTSARELIKFVDNYRKLAKVPNPVRTAFYVRDAARRVVELSGVHHACVTFEEKTPDVLLYADEGQIVQILINLVKNAVQAGARQVRMTAGIDVHDSVIIDVWNDGPPIKESEQEDIFIPFFTTKPDGTGIGLSLSRQIMRLHGGSLSLTRSDVSGTVFTLVFR